MIAIIDHDGHTIEIDTDRLLADAAPRIRGVLRGYCGLYLDGALIGWGDLAVEAGLELRAYAVSVDGIELSAPKESEG